MKASLIAWGKVKSRISEFKRTGQVTKAFKNRSPAKPNAIPEVFKASSLNKCVQILRNQYDGLIFDENNQMINTSKITSRDITNSNKRSQNLLIFKNLLKLKRLDKKPIDKMLLFTLLGIKPLTLKDKIQMTKQTELLIEQDKDFERAKYLLRLSFRKNTPSMNRVMEVMLKNYNQSGADELKRQKNVRDALKLFNDCKKWGFIPNEQSHVILFDGIGKSLGYGELDDSTAKRLLTIYEGIKTPSLSIFNSLLFCLSKNLSDNQFEAWNLFNKLDGLKPDTQTFTIFLQGIVKNYEKKINDLSKSQDSKIYKSLEAAKLKNELIEVAQGVLLKTSKVDEYFAMQYISAFFVTSNDFVDYTPEGLRQLCAWVPELADFVNQHKISLETSKLASRSQENQSKKIADSRTDNIENGLLKVTIELARTEVKLSNNKFLMQKFIDGLSRLDRPKQFLDTIWHILSDFAGVEFKQTPKIDTLVDVTYDSDIDPDLEIVDSKLIQHIFYHVNDIFLKELKSSTICLDILQYIQPVSRLVNPHLYREVLTLISGEIEYMHRVNFNSKQERNALSKVQLEYLLKNIKRYSELVPSSEVPSEPFARVISKIIDSNWLNMRTSKTKLKYHQMVLNSAENYKNIPKVEESLKQSTSLVKKLEQKVQANH